MNEATFLVSIQRRPSPAGPGQNAIPRTTDRYSTCVNILQNRTDGQDPQNCFKNQTQVAPS